MITGKLKIQTGKGKGQVIVQAIAPDNSGMKGLQIQTKVGSTSAEFYLAHEGKIETFISTLDDMLACIQAAGETLNIISRRRN